MSPIKVHLLIEIVRGVVADCTGSAAVRVITTIANVKLSLPYTDLSMVICNPVL